MKQAKCSVCGKYKPLYGDVCSECKTLKAYEVNKKIQEEVYKSEYHNEDEKAFSGFSKFMIKEVENELKEDSEYQEYLKMSASDKRKWEFNKICDMNFISKDIQVKFKPQLLQIMKKYRGFLLDGDVSICTKSEYESTGRGEVCDIIGNFVIRRFTSTKEDGVEIKSSILVDTDTLLRFLLGEEDIDDIKGEEITDIVNQIQIDFEEMGIDIEDLEEDLE